MDKVSFSDGIGISGIVLAIVLVVLDKAGKLRGPWLYFWLVVAGLMTLFIAIGKSWVLDASDKWKIWRGILVFCTVALFYSGIAVWVSEGREKETAKPQETSNADERPPASTQGSERAALFNSINDFISKKDELELRENFDIPTVTRDAILEAKIQLTPASATQAERDTVTRDMVDGQNVFYLRYVHKNGDNITPLAGKSGILHLTPKAVQSRKQLAIFYSSALAPLDVSNGLKDLEKAISDNQEILMDTINESYAAKPATISNALSCPKEDCMTVNNLFYSRFIQLQPKATVVTAAMRKYMESHQL